MIKQPPDFRMPYNDIESLRYNRLLENITYEEGWEFFFMNFYRRENFDIAAQKPIDPSKKVNIGFLTYKTFDKNNNEILRSVDHTAGAKIFPDGTQRAMVVVPLKYSGKDPELLKYPYEYNFESSREFMPILDPRAVILARNYSSMPSDIAKSEIVFLEDPLKRNYTFSEGDYTENYGPRFIRDSNTSVFKVYYPEEYNEWSGMSIQTAPAPGPYDPM